MKYRVVLIAKEVEACPLYEKGDKIAVNLPDIDIDTTDKICGFIIGQLLIDKLSKKDMICELLQEFPNKNSYCEAFNIKDNEELICPRLNTKVSFEIKIEERVGEVYLEELQEFKGRSDKKEIISKLKKIPILSSIEPQDLFDILAEIKIKKCQPGEIVIEKGQPGKYLYIIYNGEVEIIQPFKKGTETVIGRLKKGECFGEMSLLTGEKVSATIKACKPCTLLMIGKTTLRHLLERDPNMGIKFTKLLAERIKTTNQRISMVIASGMAGQLHTISFPDLVQTLSSTDTTGILHLTSQGKRGKVYFRNGQIVDAVLENINGEEAFYKMLEWNKGNFRFEQKEEIDKEQNIKCDPMGLLLEGMRRLDEAGKEDIHLNI